MFRSFEIENSQIEILENGVLSVGAYDINVKKYYKKINGVKANTLKYQDIIRLVLA